MNKHCIVAAPFGFSARTFANAHPPYTVSHIHQTKNNNQPVANNQINQMLAYHLQVLDKFQFTDMSTVPICQFLFPGAGMVLFVLIPSLPSTILPVLCVTCLLVHDEGMD